MNETETSPLQVPLDVLLTTLRKFGVTSFKHGTFAIEFGPDPTERYADDAGNHLDPSPFTRKGG